MNEPFGKYQLTERLASGGMAEVFLATIHGEAGFVKPVVIKRLHPHLSQDREIVRMLIDEARITAQLLHGNICQVLDLGEVQGAYYIALEHISGEDLRALQDACTRRQIVMPTPLIAYLLAEVLAGLDFAHRKDGVDGASLGIIHRDISPQNILVSYEGEVKIIDFGIAKARTRLAHTQAGVIKGKFRYMSPEQAAGETLDQRTDIFAAGVVLYELLCGTPHAADLSDAEAIWRIHQGTFEPIARYRPGLQPALEQIVLRALQRRPEDRFATAGDFRAALLQFLHEQGETCGRAELAAFMRRVFDIDQRRRRIGSFPGGPLDQGSLPEGSPTRARRASAPPLGRIGSDADPIQRSTTDPFSRAPSDPMPRVSTDPMPRVSTAPMPRVSTDPMPRVSTDSRPTPQVATDSRPTLPEHELALELASLAAPLASDRAAEDDSEPTVAMYSLAAEDLELDESAELSEMPPIPVTGQVTNGLRTDPEEGPTRSAPRAASPLHLQRTARTDPEEGPTRSAPRATSPLHLQRTARTDPEEGPTRSAPRATSPLHLQRTARTDPEEGPTRSAPRATSPLHLQHAARTGPEEGPTRSAPRAASPLHLQHAARTGPEEEPARSAPHAAPHLHLQRTDLLTGEAESRPAPLPPVNTGRPPRLAAPKTSPRRARSSSRQRWRLPLFALIGLSLALILGAAAFLLIHLLEKPAERAQPLGLTGQTRFPSGLGRAPDASPAAALTQLKLRSRPAGARITLCGRPTDRTTPATLAVDLRQTCIIELELPGYERYRLPVPPRESRTVTILATLRRARPDGNGTLRVTSSHVGTVYVDDQAVGRTPEFTTSLPAGNYAVKMLIPTIERHTATRMVTITAGQTTSLHFDP